MTNEKKKTIVLTVILVVLALALIIAFITSNLKGKENVTSSEEVEEILNDFDKYFNSAKRTVIYYASHSCSYCSLQTPILETIASDYDMDYYYLDSSKLSVTQRADVLQKLGIEHATPTTVIVEKGKVIDVAVGYTEGLEYVEFFKKNELLPDDAVYSSEQYITFIDYEKYNELISNNNTHVIVIGQTTCSHCIAFKPAINAVAKDNNIIINYLNITKLSQDEYNDFLESLKKIEYNDEDFVNNGEFGTPLTLVVKDGKVTGYISGERTISQLVRELKKLDII